jgi:hypothetical protein
MNKPQKQVQGPDGEKIAVPLHSPPPTHELTINGCIVVPSNVDHHKFFDQFVAFLDGHGYSFGGGIGPFVIEDKGE